MARKDQRGRTTLCRQMANPARIMAQMTVQSDCFLSQLVLLPDWVPPGTRVAFCFLPNDGRIDAETVFLAPHTFDSQWPDLNSRDD